MERLLIIDGNNLLFQMFYGLPNPIYNKEGRAIHGTIGFISAVIKEIKLYEVTKAIVVFDSDEAKERVEEYPEYKGNRENNWETLPLEEVPFSQEEDIKRALDYMGVKYVYSVGTEADDYIGFFAKKANESGWNVLISSFDSDFFQLINNHTSILRYRGKSSVIWDKDKFFVEYSFSPQYYPLYKAIVGDSSDNIPGLDGFGKIRTSRLIKYYEEHGSFDGAPLSEKQYKTMVDGKNTIERNLGLIKLKGLDDNKIKLEELSFCRERVEEGNGKVLRNAGIL